jgi:toxin ParE1/3/4
MPVKFLWTPQAREDLLEIYVTIGLDNADAADRVFSNLESRAASLLLQPRLGPRRPDIRISTRVLVQGPYLLLYETHPDTDDGAIESIVIVRVVDGRRDLTAPF